MPNYIETKLVLDCLSCDAQMYGYCGKCEGIREIDEYGNVCLSCDYQVSELEICQYVHEVLDIKRKDDHYPDLLSDIRANGMKTPIFIEDYPWEPLLSNGHHRCAAAVDLGMKTVPFSTKLANYSDWVLDKPLASLVV